MDICVEDLFLVADLEALGIPWVRRLAAGHTSHEEVALMRTLLHSWGPNDEDVEDLLDLGAHSPQMWLAAQRTRNLIRAVQAWEAPGDRSPRR